MTCRRRGISNKDDTVSCAGCGDTTKMQLINTGHRTATPNHSDAPLPPASPAHSYCTQCGKPYSANTRFCQYCGTPRQAVAHTGQTIKHKKKRIAFIAGIAAAAVMVIAAAMLLAGRSPAATAFYYKFDAIYAANLATLSTYEVSDEAGSIEDNYVLSAYTFTSPDGRYLFYPEGDDIYRRDLKAGPKDNGAAVKVDSDVGYFFEVTPDNKAVYIKQSNGGLYVSDGENREKAAHDVTYCLMNKGGTQLIYANADSDLYMLDIWALSTQKIVSEANLLSVSDDFTTVCYQKNGNLYEHAVGEDSEKITSGLSMFIARMDDGTLYYTKSETETIALADYLNDDMQESDAAMAEPDIAAFQALKPYTTWWGDTAYETVTDDDAFDAAYNAYNDKLMRDELRMQAAAQTMDFSHETLYAYKDGDETVVTENFAYTLTTSRSGLLVYKKTAFTPPEKVNISEAGDINALTALARNYQSKGNAVYAVMDGEETLLIEESPSTFAIDGTFFYSEDDKKLYFIDDFDTAESCGALKYISVSDNGFSSPQIVDEDVSTCTFDSSTNTLLYVKELQNGCGDLFMNGTKIDSDVSLYGMLLSKDAQTLYYMMDADTNGFSATLMKWSEAGKERVAYDVMQAVLVSDQLVYLADFSALSHRGDLYLYSGAGSRLIDDDVSYLFDTERYATKPMIYFMDVDGSFLDTDE